VDCWNEISNAIAERVATRQAMLDERIQARKEAWRVQNERGDG